MRTRRQARGLAFSVLLLLTLSSIPAIAAPPGRDGGGRDGGFPGIMKVIKSVVRFVLHPLDELGLPHP